MHGFDSCLGAEAAFGRTTLGVVSLMILVAATFGIEGCGGGGGGGTLDIGAALKVAFARD